MDGPYVHVNTYCLRVKYVRVIGALIYMHTYLLHMYQ